MLQNALTERMERVFHFVVRMNPVLPFHQALDFEIEESGAADKGTMTEPMQSQEAISKSGDF